MTRAQRAYIVAMSAIIGGAFAYAAADWGQWPRLRYVPLTGEVTFGDAPPTALAYWGLVLWGLGGVVVGGLAGVLLARLFPKPWQPRTYQLFGAWAITAIVLAGCYFTWSLWPF